MINKIHKNYILSSTVISKVRTKPHPGQIFRKIVVLVNFCVKISTVSAYCPV